MSELPTLGMAFVAGAALGALFLFALWRSLQRQLDEGHAVAWMLANMVLRIVVVTLLFYGVLKLSDWRHLLAAVFGFILTRLVLVHRIRLPQPGGLEEKTP